MGSLSLTASRASHRAFFSPFVPDVHHVSFPNCRQHGDRVDHRDCGREVIDYLERVVFRYEVVPEEVAAIFVEPIQGEGGYIVPPDDFLPSLQNLCRRHGILLIADEIQSGFGRTGKMFACEHWGVVPDVMCVAKGIASGMPLGAMIAREAISTWPRSSHGSTFGGNPVACAAALATIEVIEDGLVANAAEQGSYLKQCLIELKARHPAIADVRGVGLMIGVEFQEGADGAPAARLRDLIMRRCFESGLLLLGCGESTLRFCPPLVVNRAEVDSAVQVFGAVLDAANS
jgi:4-aminobutyrate aminotransferase